MPRNLEQWMEAVAATIDEVRQNGDGVASRPEWAATHRSDPDAQKVEIKTALWALSTVIFVLVILLVIGMNFSAGREEGTERRRKGV